MDTCGIYNNDKEEFPKENDEGETMKEIKLLKIYHLHHIMKIKFISKLANTIITFKEQLSRAGFIYLNMVTRYNVFIVILN